MKLTELMLRQIIRQVLLSEIVNPTQRWAVINRLVKQVPDRPEGAGNFTDGGQFNSASARRMMKGRHSAERSAKRLWNEMVDEMGTRDFFDSKLVKVHWIGLYVKLGRNVVSDTLSFIEQNAGSQHADEISATAYHPDDLPKVSFSRPTIGVILDGRVTYAGAVDLGTQWTSQLKPEDIARQAASGTRKLPWYEDEGTVADNMVLDEKSWRDHVWGPNYYRTEMPELIVGNWSFSKVLVPRAVAVKLTDGMGQIKSAARVLGLDVVDEIGSSYMSEVD
jgi:hypothetical protein